MANEYNKETIRRMVPASQFLSNDAGVNDHVAGGFKWCLEQIEKAEAELARRDRVNALLVQDFDRWKAAMSGDES